MAEDGLIGSGVKVAYSASSPITWIPVGQLLDPVVPGLDPAEVETTVHGTSNFRRHIRGLIDVSEMTLKLLADLDETTNAAQHAMYGFQASGATIYWRVEIPTTRDRTKYTAFEFRGWVKKWVPTAPIDNRQELDCSVRFDDVTFTKFPAGASQIT
jgi:hypothetical protein